jgi:hypothetical protein
MDIKRQASLIKKQFNISHSESLDFAARLQGFEHYFAYNQNKKREEILRDYIKQDIEAVEVIKAPRIGSPKYEVKLKVLTEVKTLIQIDADSLEEAISKAEELIEKENMITFDWKPTFIEENEIKIVDVQDKQDKTKWKVNNSAGLQSYKVNWRF